MEAFGDEKTFGPYQLHAKIAEGGMAEVMLGTSQQKEFQGQFLAIKRLRPHLNSNRPFVKLLIHEAKIGVLLNHPGIAAVYDLGSYKSEFFMTMEYVHGKSLDKILERIEKAKTPKLSIEVATYIVLEILRAVAFAHQLKDAKGRDLNIIHRDISPGNILLSYRGEVKLSDFGIATAENRLQPNFSNMPIGKLAYMAPEQVVNDPVVRASDIYSIGVVYYQMLSGQLPFHADNANNLYKKVVDGRVTDLRMTGPTISPALRDIVNKCLNRFSGKRFQSAPELYQALVDHFNREYELDFNSKAIRQYYKKKLSEYLRASFEAEIIQEIEITQECLKKGIRQENFKVTAPQDLKRLADFEKDGPPPEEAAQNADAANEATRHFPLTEEERDRIVKGISPKAVITESRKEAEKKTAPSPFDLQTIPEYDLALEDSSVQRISVNDKLKLSSLDKDQKETLTQQAPDLEISSENDLQRFEQITFSGNRKVDENATREMSRSEVLKDFEKIKSGKLGSSSVDEATMMDLSEISHKSKNQAKEAAKVAIARLNRISGNERTTIVPASELPSSRRIWVSAIAILLVSALVGGIWFYKSKSTPMSKSISTPTGLLTPQAINLVVLGEVSIDIQKKFIQVLNEGSDSLASIENIFSSEFKRYRNQDQSLIKISTSEPLSIIGALSSQPNAGQMIRTDAIFEFFNHSGVPSNSLGDSTIYIYLYPFDPASNQNSAFPDHWMGQHSNKRGVVFAPVHSSKKLFVLENIAREIAILYGARNKEDPTTGLVIPPDGLADPKELPMYPQTRAELMGRDIPLSGLQERSINSMKEIVIGPQTAFELGWITSEKRNELMK